MSPTETNPSQAIVHVETVSRVVSSDMSGWKDRMKDDVLHLCGPTDYQEASGYLQHGSGTGRRLLILGESPSRTGWRVSGRAFYDPQGRLVPSGVRLNSLLEPLGVSLESCAFTELVKCFVGVKRNLLPACAARSWSLLNDQIRVIRPSIVLAMGKRVHELVSKNLVEPPPFGEVSSVTLGDGSVNYLAIYHPSPISPVSTRENPGIMCRAHQRLQDALRG